jgi:Ca2+/Na+ antiporter
MKDRDYIMRRIFQIKNEYRKIQTYKWGLRGIVVGLITVLIYLFTIIKNSLIFDSLIFIIVFLLPFMIFVFFGYKKSISEKKVINKADQKLGLEERLITYLDYRDKSCANPFVRPLEKQLTEIIKRIPRDPIFKLKWNPELQLIGIFLAIIVFATTWFNVGSVEIANNLVRNTTITETSIAEKETVIKKIELLDPLESALKKDKNSDEKSANLKERDKLNSGNSNQELDRKIEQGESEKKEEENLNALKDRLKKIEPGKKGSQNQAEVDGLGGAKKKNGENSYLSKNDRNKDGINREKDKIFKKNKEDKQSESNKKDGGSGPSAKGGKVDESKSSEDQGHNAMDEENKSSGGNQLETNQPGGESKDEDSKKVGPSPGNQDSEIKYGDQFADSDQKGKMSKLKSQLSADSYLKTYLEENYTPHNMAENENLLDSYLQHRSFLLDSLRQGNVPSHYKEMIKDYFTIIKD